MNKTVEIDQRLVNTYTVAHLIKEINPELDNEKIKELVDSIPTAYDADKVIEELEMLNDKGSVSKTEKLITKATVNKAVKIVERGGINEI